MRERAQTTPVEPACYLELALPAGRPGMEARSVQLDGVTERELVERTRAGEAEAFGELVRRHMRRAYFSALGLTGSAEDARDLSQDAFVRAWGARRSLDPARPFFAWLYQIVRRLCFNFLRDRGSRRRKLDEAEPWLVAQAEARSPAEDPAAAVERRRQTERLTRAIAALKPHDREVLVLKEFEDLRYREIAELLGIPIGTVMSRLYSARRRLADAMGEER